MSVLERFRRVNSQREVVDLEKRKLVNLEAAIQGEAENLTREELANILGVKRGAKGNIPGTKLANACSQVYENPVVKEFPIERRLIVIRSAIDVLDSLQSGKSE